MKPAIPFSFPGIGGDIRRLKKLMVLALRTSGWKAPAKPAILNLACGRADETGVLISLLTTPASPFFYMGIDLREPEIMEAQARWLPGCVPGQEMAFMPGDATRIDRLKQLPRFDFIFIRHQNYWSAVDDWTRLYRNAISALKDSGILMITSYFDKEHELADACLMQLGVQRIADIPNMNTRPLGDAPGKSVDKRLAIYSKLIKPQIS